MDCIITITAELKDKLLSQHWEQTRHGVWIYGLTEDRDNFWYIGSTVNPASRIIEHHRHQTRDTKDRITEDTRMILLDNVAPEDRLTTEALWISRTPTATNTCRYDDLIKKNTNYKTQQDILLDCLARMGL